MRSSSRSAFSFPDLRRILLRAARGSPPMGRLCDPEKGIGAGGSSGGAAQVGNSPMLGTAGGATMGSNTKSQTSSSDRHASSHNLHGTPHNHHIKNSNTSTNIVTSSPGIDDSSTATTNCEAVNECPICYNISSTDELYPLSICKHAACRKCLESYLKTEINESRTDIACPECSETMHPSDIETLLHGHPSTMAKYEDFMVRRVLLSDPDSRWCPAPNCSYAVLATGCASCPLIRCERPGCQLAFCYHCKAEWHPDQTCDAARASRHSPTRATSGSISQDSQHRDDIKPCPRCQVLIVKMNDGSCNHMVCAVCGSEFCWLCMKEISDLHYLSPSGCTFWGKKPWSRKKKLLWQLGTLIGAPVGIALVAGIAVPAMIIGIPVWVGRKIHARYKLAGKHKRNFAVLGAVTASVLAAPVLAAFAVAIGVPILLFYVYGVVPVSLCRAGCGVSTSRDGFKFDLDEEYTRTRNQDATSVDAVSRIGATSIGEVSLSVASGPLPHPMAPNSSTTALAGSIGPSSTATTSTVLNHRLEVQADVTSETASTQDAASTKALAGSILSQNPQQTDSEDGGSVRKSVSYMIDGRRDADGWFISPEQDHCADKLSLCSGRSLRSSERSYRGEVDSMSLSSAGGHRRMMLGQRMFKLTNRNVSMESTTGSSNCIAELKETCETSAGCGVGGVQQPPADEMALYGEEEEVLHSIVVRGGGGSEIQQTSDDENRSQKATAAHCEQQLEEEPLASIQLSPTQSSSASNDVAKEEECPTVARSHSLPSGDGTTADGRGMSKTAILRNIFFSQIASPPSPQT